MAKPSNLVPLVAAFLLFYTSEAFSPALPRTRCTSVSPMTVVGAPLAGRDGTQLRASEEGEDEPAGLPTLPSQMDVPVSRAPVTAPVEPTPVARKEVVVEEEEETSYPINLPSPVLLGLSMVLAISSTGESSMRKLFPIV